MSMLSKLLKPLRRWAKRRTRTATPPEVYPLIELAPSDLSQLLFGQQHLGTQDYFARRCGQYHTVPLDAFPHRQFIRALAAGEPRPEQQYLDYLQISWEHYRRKQNTPALRAAFHDPVMRAAHVYELGAVTVVLVLMLTKPF